ncbi:HAD family hydrolase [Phaeobacter sp. C3_T13_0]|uniref:HAD family hydrolase n=1 Tax=Phaeobacter cretensis TaxID=3342641 RepID=UPI0039BCF6FB
MTIKAVVFDIGRVLIEWEPERFYDAKIGKSKREALFREVDLHGMNLGVDRGDDFKGAVYALADRHPEWADEIRHWHDSWLQMASPDIPHSVRLMRELRQNGVPVFALTNFGVGTFELAKITYPFFSEFDRAFVSGHLRTIKPEAEIYAHLEQETGIAPKQLLFTDDRPENIEAAAARGWQTHLFTHPQTWADRLVSEGLLTAEAAQ